MLQPERRTTSFRFQPSPSTGQSTHPSSGCDRRRRGTCLNVNEKRGERQNLSLLCQYWNHIRKTVTNSSGFLMLNSGVSSSLRYIWQCKSSPWRSIVQHLPNTTAEKMLDINICAMRLITSYSHLLSLLKFAIWKFLITCTAKDPGWQWNRYKIRRYFKEI